jgi:hypothetical protein
MQNWIPNFNKLDITIDVGTMNSGKYTLPNMPMHQSIQVPVRQTVSNHTVIPAKLNKNGGTVPVLIP